LRAGLLCFCRGSLTFNHDGRNHDLGTGYGHVALAVDDLGETLAQLREAGNRGGTRPYRVHEGGSLICLAQDADSYRIELIHRSGK
jgi:lactoylglutathione lyase